MAPLVSVLIPAYNAAGTLREAVNSVLAQGVHDLEILIVDDGSTDETPALCEALCCEDVRIRVFRQKNAGISAARNTGLRYAAGQWVAFCDDDDCMLPDALPTLLQAVNSREVDVVRGDYELLCMQANGGYVQHPHSTGLPCKTDAQGGFGSFLAQCGPQFVWNALYRRTALAEISFREDCRYGVEDFIFNYEVYAKARTAVYLPVCVYRHYEGRDSTSALLTKEALEGRIAALTPWLQAANRAVQSRCGQNQAAVWAGCRGDAVTFLMHQLHDADAAPSVRRQAWRALRNTQKRFNHSALDAFHILRDRKKTALALLLFEIHLQDLYELLPHREEPR